MSGCANTMDGSLRSTPPKTIWGEAKNPAGLLLVGLIH